MNTSPLTIQCASLMHSLINWTWKSWVSIVGSQPLKVGPRRSGALLGLAQQILCPVVALHGDCDPHPAEGVEKPLSNVLREFRFILLKHCGHTPWIERQACEEFYAALIAELM